ncbi:MAG: TonB family protein [Pyrinomonadaceae bacterium]|nr:TonB family protein [Pyrinomonadaceae bacterium]
MAKRTRVSGPVTVQILLDEQGRVVSARATNGHPLLRAAAERAAYQTRFSPTLLSNQPVKVSGVITFNFVLN